MTLTELLTTLHTRGALPPRRLKDVQTSLRYLARALGHASPEQCTVEAVASLDPAAWKARLDTYFLALPQPPSMHTVRNTRNNLSFLFRQAAAQGLLLPATASPRLARTRKAREQLAVGRSPFAARVRAANASRYALAFADWPPAIRAGWEAYHASRQRKTRAISLNHYRAVLGRYLGFLQTIAAVPLTWETVFDPARMDQYVGWHCQRAQVRMTRQAFQFPRVLHTLAQALHYPQAAAIAAYAQDLPLPEPMHTKKETWLTLCEVEQVGCAEVQAAARPILTHGWQRLGTPSYARAAQHPGLLRAVQYQRGLVLRLLVRVPLRSRNYCEMRLGQNLYRDAQGHWRLHFQGAELKIDTRKGRVNTYQLDLTALYPEVIPDLERFLTEYRPRLPHADAAPQVFLTRHGRPFRGTALKQELAACVFTYTEKPFYPHRIRTIWATEFIARTGDFTTAAYMLGDTVQVVLREYQEILDQAHQQKASQVLADLLAGAR
jgi:hypothetical protein